MQNGIKISELNELTSLDDLDILSGVDVSASENKKIKVSNLKNFINLESGCKLEVELNPKDYKLTMRLLNLNSEVLSTQTVDLPIESLVKDIRYDQATKEIVFVLESGKEVRVNISDLVSGLVSETQMQEYVTTEINKIKGNVDETVKDIRDEFLTDQARQDEELKALLEGLPQKTVKGTDSLYYEDGQKASVREFIAKGNVEQDGEPAPDSPQEVKTLKGWNLLKVDNGQNVINTSGWGGVSYTKLETYKELKKGETYTLSFCVKKIGNSSIKLNKVNIFKYAGSDLTTYWDVGMNNYITTEFKKYYITGVCTNDLSLSIMPTLNFQTYCDNYVNETTIYISEVELTKGTEQKPYLPYGCIGRKVVGKNLFDKDSISQVNSWEYVLPNPLKKTGRYSFKLNNTSFFGKDTSYFNIKFANKTTSSSSESLMIANMNTSNSISVNITDEMLKYPYIKIFPNIQNTLNEIKDSQLKIELGEPTPYEPYQENITYIDLKGNEVFPEDTLHYDKGHLWLKKNWGKVVLDGSESWSTFNNSSPNYSYFVTGKYDSIIGINTFIEYSTHFSQSNSKITPVYITDKPVISGVNTIEDFKIRILIPSSVANNIDTFKTWLSQNKPIVYYPLATPVEIDLGEVDIKSLKGVNHVTVEAELPATYMEETYINDINKELEQIKNALLSTGANV